MEFLFAFIGVFIVAFAGMAICQVSAVAAIILSFLTAGFWLWALGAMGVFEIMETLVTIVLVIFSLAIISIPFIIVNDLVKYLWNKRN